VISGQGLVVKLNGLPKESMAAVRNAFLRIGMRADTQAKDLLRREFEAAKKAIDAEKKYEEEKKKYEEEKKKREEEEKKKKDEKPKDEKKEDKKEAPPVQEPKAPPKPDPKVQVLVDFLKGGLPGLIQSMSAAEIAHFWQVLKEAEGLTPKLSFVAASDAYRAAEPLGDRKAWVVLRPQFTMLSFTRDRVNPAAELTRAGVKIALAPVTDTLKAHESFLFHVGELVKAGLDRETAIKAFTLHPAEMLGMEKQIGSLDAGKDGDVVLLTGDPFAATTRIVRVIVAGRVVFEEGKP